MLKRFAALFFALVVVGCAAGKSGSSLAPAAFVPDGADRAARSAAHPKGANPTVFTVSKRVIQLNGQTFYIKGVDYAPTPICGSYYEPLDDTNSVTWRRDLPLMQQLGVNAVKVYNVGMTKVNGGWKPISIKHWLTAAYNGGTNPIYTILSISIPAGIIDAPTSGTNAAAITSLEHQYYELALTYGANPDVMGISIGGEWNQHPYIKHSATWKSGVNPIIQAAWQGLIDAGVGNQKILTTTLVDDLGDNANSTMSWGEHYGFPPSPKPTGPPFNGATAEFAWGFDVYRGDNPPFSGIWPQIQTQTKHAFIVSEWGEPTAQHPHPNSNPTLVQEYPSPVPTAITNYIDLGVASLYNHSTINPSPKTPVVANGGFVFEWSDEYWKAFNGPTGKQACNHIGGNLGQNPNPSGGFPTQFDDEAWFGLNAVAASPSPQPTTSTGPTASPSPYTGPNVMIPRANYTHLKADWKAQLPPT